MLDYASPWTGRSSYGFGVWSTESPWVAVLFCFVCLLLLLLFFSVFFCFFLLVWLIVTAAILQFISVLLQLLACGHNPFTPNTVSFVLFLALITNWSPLLFCALQTPSSGLCPQQTEWVRPLTAADEVISSVFSFLSQAALPYPQKTLSPNPSWPVSNSDQTHYETLSFFAINYAGLPHANCSFCPLPFVYLTLALSSHNLNTVYFVSWL